MLTGVRRSKKKAPLKELLNGAKLTAGNAHGGATPPTQTETRKRPFREPSDAGKD